MPWLPLDGVRALRLTFSEISRTLSGVMSAEEVIRIEQVEMLKALLRI